MNKKIVQRPGSELAELFDRNPLMATIKLARYKFTSKMLSSSDHVLDIGCGSGQGSLFYSQYCSRVLGLDFNLDYVDLWEQIEEKNPNVEFRVNDIFEGMDYKNFDPTGIACLDFIEHFSESQGDEIIRQFSCALEPGGLLVLGSPSVFSSQYRASHNVEQHLHEYEPDDLKALVSRYFSRSFLFSMSDEVVHTGFNKLSWYSFVVAVR